MSFAYNELSLDSKKRDEKNKNLDPKKKEQLERLGMGASGSRLDNILSMLAIYNELVLMTHITESNYTRYKLF